MKCIEAVCCSQVCVYIMPGSHVLREAVVAGHQSWEVYKAIFKQSEIYHSIVKKIVYKWRPFKTAANFSRSGLKIRKKTTTLD